MHENESIKMLLSKGISSINFKLYFVPNTSFL